MKIRQEEEDYEGDVAGERFILHEKVEELTMDWFPNALAPNVGETPEAIESKNGRLFDKGGDPLS